MQTSTFEAYVLELLAVLERLPVPIAVAFDVRCERVQGNGAFRKLIGTEPVSDANLPLQRAAREGLDVADVALQIGRPDGGMHQLITSAWPLRDSMGRVAGSIGVYVDVTQSTEAEQRAQHAISALAESERRYRLITEAMPQFVWLDAADGSALYANQRWLDYTGLSEEQNLGFGWESVVHPGDLKRLESERARTLKAGAAYEGECRYRGKDGKYRWFLFRSIPVRDESGSITSWLGTATDIDNQKRAKDQQEFFALASDLLASTLDVEGTLERIARLAIASLGTWCQIDLPDAQGRLRVAMIAHQDPAKERALRVLLGERIYAADTQAGPPGVMSTGRPQLLKHVDDAAVRTVIPDAGHREIYRSVGYVAGVMVPLRTRNRIVGVLGIASDDPTRLYTDFDVTTALELGRRGASALENARSFEREHRVATTLQKALLPATLPSSECVRFHCAYAAASAAEGEAVGGDWYDAFALDATRIAVSMGDVAGHGVDAAVTMGTVRQALRSAALDGKSPKDVLTHANRIVVLEDRAAMITALFGVYDTQTREFTISIAGHPRPVAVSADGTLAEFDSIGPPLGLAFDPEHIAQRTFALAPNSAVVFYTDGLLEYDHQVVEAAERLSQIVRTRSFLAAEQPAQAIIEAVLDAPQRDDIAVLVMQTGG
jgi:PAS domain S-box-containing protein